MPRAAVNPLTYDEHRELAEKIQKTRWRLVQLSSVVVLRAELRALAEADCPGLDASTFYK